MDTERPDWRQAGYEIEALRAGWPACADQTGRVESDQSVLVPWPFAPLPSRERLTVRVRVWGADGQRLGLERAARRSRPGCSSRPTGPRASSRPAGRRIRAGPSPRRCCAASSTCEPGVAQARLYVTALGVYEAQINGAGGRRPRAGARAGPATTHRLRYQTYDVTGLLREGSNAIGAMLGDGWYRGRLGFGGGRRNIYGDRLALLAQLEIDYADGTTDAVVTDDGWRAATGPIVASGHLRRRDLRRPPGAPRLVGAGLRRRRLDAGRARSTATSATLVAPTGPPVRRIERSRPVAHQPPRRPGRTLVDFGQNLVGRLRLTVRGRGGHDDHPAARRGARGRRAGHPAAAHGAQATDRYTLRGGGAETWEPRFTFHGFRYAEVDGLARRAATRRRDPRGRLPLRPGAHRLVRVLRPAGQPAARERRLGHARQLRRRAHRLPAARRAPRLDRRHRRSSRPPRAFLYDSAGLPRLLAGRPGRRAAGAGGIVPVVVPNILDGPPFPAAAWGDAAAIVPWVLYQRYGDAGMLADQFESMRAWVDAVAAIAGESHLWDDGLPVRRLARPGRAAGPTPRRRARPPHLVATAYLARSAELVGQAAGVLGRAEEAGALPAAWPPRCAPPSAPSTSRPPGAC